MVASCRLLCARSGAAEATPAERRVSPGPQVVPVPNQSPIRVRSQTAAPKLFLDAAPARRLLRSRQRARRDAPVHVRQARRGVRYMRRERCPQKRKGCAALAFAVTSARGHAVSHAAVSGRAPSTPAAGCPRRGVATATMRSLARRCALRGAKVGENAPQSILVCVHSLAQRGPTAQRRTALLPAVQRTPASAVRRGQRRSRVLARTANRTGETCESAAPSA